MSKNHIAQWFGERVIKGIEDVAAIAERVQGTGRHTENTGWEPLGPHAHSSVAPIKRATLISTTRPDPAVISFSPAPVVSSVLSLSLRPCLCVPPPRNPFSYVSPRPSRPSRILASPASTRSSADAHALGLHRAPAANCVVRTQVNYRSSARLHTRGRLSCTYKASAESLRFADRQACARTINNLSPRILRDSLRLSERSTLCSLVSMSLQVFWIRLNELLSYPFDVLINAQFLKWLYRVSQT